MTTETTEAPPASVRMLRRDAVLRHLNRTNPMMSIIKGDVVQLADGRRIARYEGGTAVYFKELADDVEVDGYIARYLEGQSRAREIQARMNELQAAGKPYLGQRPSEVAEFDWDLINGATGIDPYAEVQGRVDAMPDQWHPFDTTLPEDREVQAFTSLYPSIAKRLNVETTTTNRLFSPGRCWSFRNSPMRAVESWRPYLDRHTAGDHGEHGEHDPTAVTAAERWSIGLCDQPTRNRHAIQSGTGVVRSVYRIPEPLQQYVEQRHMPWQAKRVAVVEVTSGLLGGGQASTTMTTGFIDA